MPRHAVTHTLNTYPVHFEDLSRGAKTFEVRKADRDFKVGDDLELVEWLPDAQRHTGRSVKREVTHILLGGQFGIEAGYCVMSLMIPWGR